MSVGRGVLEERAGDRRGVGWFRRELPERKEGENVGGSESASLLQETDSPVGLLFPSPPLMLVEGILTSHAIL